MRIERQAARFMVDVADAIAAVKSGKTSYGEFYVTKVELAFDGDPTNYQIVLNEHEDYDLIEG